MHPLHQTRVKKKEGQPPKLMRQMGGKKGEKRTRLFIWSEKRKKGEEREPPDKNPGEGGEREKGKEGPHSFSACFLKEEKKKKGRRKSLLSLSRFSAGKNLSEERGVVVVIASEEGGRRKKSAFLWFPDAGGGGKKKSPKGKEYSREKKRKKQAVS